MDFRSFLASPAVYRLFARLVAGERRYMLDYLRPHDGDRILDIGCGPAQVLERLPETVQYVGIDISARYIAHARARFGSRGRFICKPLREVAADEPGTFDTALLYGLLHHLDDEEAGQALRLAATLLKPGGRLVTFDGCRVPEQSALARFIIGRDRGRHIREPAQYVRLARSAFATVEPTVRHDLLRIPYTLLVMECRTA